MTTENGVPVILRPGAITKEQLEHVVGKVTVDQHLISEKEAPKAPGMKYKHYSPDVPVWIIDGDKNVFDKAIHWAKSKNQRIGLFASERLTSAFSTDVTATFSFGEESVEQGPSSYLQVLEVWMNRISMLFLPKLSQNQS